MPGLVGAYGLIGKSDHVKLIVVAARRVCGLVRAPTPAHQTSYFSLGPQIGAKRKASAAWLCRNGRIAWSALID